MRQGYSRITPAVVHQQARLALQQVLDWQPYQQSLSVTDLLRLLLLMAAYNGSLFGIVRRFFSVCHETASRAVKAQLSSQARLTDGLVDGLHHVLAFSRSDRRRHWFLAIDTHLVGYYGQPTAQRIGGPKKQGTRWFFGYATAVLLHAQRRYTVGLIAVRPRQKPHEIVQALLAQLTRKGLKLRGVTLDAAFGSGDTIGLLQQARLAYAIALPRFRGAKHTRNLLFEGRHNQVRWTDWNIKRTGQPIRTRTFLWKGSRKTMLLAFDRWSGERAHHVHRLAQRARRLYQQRFGIETSYRQKNQGQAHTTSRDPVYRLLLEGVAYLLRQVWVVLTEQIARSYQAKASAWIGQLPFATMLDWLGEALRNSTTEKRSIPLPKTT